MSNQRTVVVTDWLSRSTTADFTFWPLSEGKHRHAELDGRMTINVSTGNVILAIRPTADEARKLIEALRWALDAEEVTS